MKLLLVEDDAEISGMLADYLRAEQFEVAAACDGQSACRAFAADRYDLVLLDLMIPPPGGIEVLKRIRQASTVPVIILSARDTDSDITLGLSLGADDYITKPFSVAQLLARIKAQIRRATQYGAPAPGGAAGVIRRCGLTLDPGAHTVCKGGAALALTAKEFEILKLLMQNPQRVYTKAQLYALVWNDPYLGDENAVNVQISRLRNKIEDEPRRPQIVVTVWGIGYKLGEGIG